MSGPIGDCPRTPGLVDRVVDDRVTVADRAHAAGCPTCGPVLARAAAFEDELRRSARSLIAEDLPRGILEQELGGRSTGVVARRAAPGFAAILAAVAILLVTTVIALAPGATPTVNPSSGTTRPSSGANPSPATPEKPFVERLSKTALIVAKLTSLGYRCNDGGAVESPGSGPTAVVKESAACTSPEKAGPFTMAVIVGEAANGKVVEVTIKADVVPDTTENRALLSDQVAQVLVVSTVDELPGQSGSAWIKAHLSELNAGEQLDYGINGVGFHAERMPNQTFLIVVQGTGLT